MGFGVKMYMYDISDYPPVSCSVLKNTRRKKESPLKKYIIRNITSNTKIICTVILSEIAHGCWNMNQKVLYLFVKEKEISRKYLNFQQYSNEPDLSLKKWVLFLEFIQLMNSKRPHRILQLTLLLFNSEYTAIFRERLSEKCACDNLER